MYRWSLRVARPASQSRRQRRSDHMATQRAGAKLQDDFAGAVVTQAPMATSQSAGGLCLHAHHAGDLVVVCRQKERQQG